MIELLSLLLWFGMVLWIVLTGALVAGLFWILERLFGLKLLE